MKDSKQQLIVFFDSLGKRAESKEIAKKCFDERDKLIKELTKSTREA